MKILYIGQNHEENTISYDVDLENLLNILFHKDKVLYVFDYFWTDSFTDKVIEEADKVPAQLIFAMASLGYFDFEDFKRNSKKIIFTNKLNGNELKL